MNRFQKYIILLLKSATANVIVFLAGTILVSIVALFFWMVGGIVSIFFNVPIEFPPDAMLYGAMPSIQWGVLIFMSTVISIAVVTGPCYVIGWLVEKWNETANL